jgi:methionyl-tRNA synthetase
MGEFILAYCDECGETLKPKRETKCVSIQGGQTAAELCETCRKSLTVEDAINHMLERQAKSVRVKAKALTLDP